MNEKELIANLKLGSMDAFDKIYSIYFKRLYAYCLKFTKSSENAEEIVHDTLLRLWNIRQDIRQEETLESLLFIISKNYLIKAYHKTINSYVFEDYLEYKDLLKADGRTDYALDYDDYLKNIKELMSTLPQTQQKVIVLSKIKELSIEEVAAQLSLSEQTVRNQLSKGLRTLRELLDKQPFILLIIIKTILQ